MKTWLTGALDRAVRTALQILAAYMTVAVQLDQVNWYAAASAVGLGVIASVVTSVWTLPSFGSSWVFQLLERAVKTFVQSLSVFLVEATVLTDVDWGMALDMSLYAALFSIVTSTATTRLGSAPGEVDLTAPKELPAVHSPIRTRHTTDG